MTSSALGASIFVLEIGESIITNNKDKANAFNDFFLKAELDSSEATLPNQQRIVQYDALKEIDVTELDVLDQLKTLDPNKAYGDDVLPPKL